MRRWLCSAAHRVIAPSPPRMGRSSASQPYVPESLYSQRIRMITATGARDNRLLAALPDAAIQPWLPLLEPVDLPLGLVLYESGRTLGHVYFPTTAIASLMFILEDGSSTETAVVGNEGVVGVSLFMGGGSTPSRGIVQGAGRGYRLAARALMEAFELNGAVTRLMLRYTQALITQMAQTAACNRHHTLEKQLCRWLLLRVDRLAGNELVVTQELIASMLGVRREGVTEAALKLQAAGLIRYSRGHVTLLDLPGLERRSCECYAVVTNEYRRLLPDLMPAQLPSQGSAGRAVPCRFDHGAIDIEDAHAVP